ncbi:CRISPR-associated protein, Csy4 family [Chitinispirillum alkaliphilum]|nr:CRISPR-associated protein, Csy4 family [Chitinispirillum alkaliphilum]
MDYYFDVLILPDTEFPPAILMNSLYTKLHKALWDLKSTTIGVSFPRCKVTLGNLLRIHGTDSDLRELQAQNWIGGMSGYCKVSEILPVPKNANFRTVSRKQPNMSQSKLNRLIKRGSIPEDEIKQYKAKMFSKGLDEPYVELVSKSNSHKHRRYFEFGELQETPTLGVFDQFGLSKTATIPYF